MQRASREVVEKLIMPDCSRMLMERLRHIHEFYPDLNEAILYEVIYEVVEQNMHIIIELADHRTYEKTGEQREENN